MAKWNKLFVADAINQCFVKIQNRWQILWYDFKKFFSSNLKNFVRIITLKCCNYQIFVIIKWWRFMHETLWRRIISVNSFYVQTYIFSIARPVHAYIPHNIWAYKIFKHETYYYTRFQHTSLQLFSSFHTLNHLLYTVHLNYVYYYIWI